MAIDTIKLNNETVKIIPNKTDLINMIYPVGSIYMSVTSTSPVTLFGGIWTQLKDRFLLGAGSSYSNGSIGGTKQHSHAAGNLRALFSAHKANGQLNFLWDSSDSFTPNYTMLAEADSNISNSSDTETDGIVVSGTTAQESSMPPYLVVYMWKRIA